MSDINESNNHASEIIPEFKEVKSPDNKTDIILIRKVVVGLQDESYYATPWCHMVRECSRQQNQVYYKKSGTHDKRTDGISIMDMMILGLFRDSLVVITMEGEDRERLRRGALRIYSGITTRGERPDFERLERAYGRVFPNPIL